MANRDVFFGQNHRKEQHDYIIYCKMPYDDNTWYIGRDGKMTAFKSNAQHFETYEQALAEKQAFPFWNCMDLIEAGLIDNEAEYDRIWHICKV